MAPKVQEEGGEQKGQITTLTSSVGGVELVPLAFVAERGKERSQKGKSHFKELLPAEKPSRSRTKWCTIVPAKPILTKMVYWQAGALWRWLAIDRKNSNMHD